MTLHYLHVIGYTLTCLKVFFDAINMSKEFKTVKVAFLAPPTKEGGNNRASAINVQYEDGSKLSKEIIRDSQGKIQKTKTSVFPLESKSPQRVKTTSRLINTQTIINPEIDKKVSWTGERFAGGKKVFQLEKIFDPKTGKMTFRRGKALYPETGNTASWTEEEFDRDEKVSRLKEVYDRETGNIFSRTEEEFDHGKKVSLETRVYDPKLAGGFILSTNKMVFRLEEKYDYGEITSRVEETLKPNKIISRVEERKTEKFDGDKKVSLEIEKFDLKTGKRVFRLKKWFDRETGKRICRLYERSDRKTGHTVSLIEENFDRKTGNKISRLEEKFNRKTGKRVSRIKKIFDRKTGKMTFRKFGKEWFSELGLDD